MDSQTIALFTLTHLKIIKLLVVDTISYQSSEYYESNGINPAARFFNFFDRSFNIILGLFLDIIVNGLVSFGSSERTRFLWASREGLSLLADSFRLVLFTGNRGACKINLLASWSLKLLIFSWPPSLINDLLLGLQNLLSLGEATDAFSSLNLLAKFDPKLAVTPNLSPFVGLWIWWFCTIVIWRSKSQFFVRNNFFFNDSSGLYCILLWEWILGRK